MSYQIPQMHHLIKIFYINLLLNSSETATKQMHKRNWDDGWESIQEEEEGMRLGNMRTWQVWNSSFPMNNSSGMKHKLPRINAQWKNIGENRWIGHILKNIMIYTLCHSVLKWGRNRSRRSLRKMLSSSGSLDFFDTVWWNANTRQKYATQNKKLPRAGSSYISDTYQYIIRTSLLSAQAESISLSGVWFRHCS